MYCDPVTENGTIEHGKIDYSYPVSPENTDFMYINTTYRVECDPGYFPANRKRVKCVINHRQRSSRWNGNLTNCSKYLQVYVVVYLKLVSMHCTHNIMSSMVASRWLWESETSCRVTHCTNVETESQNNRFISGNVTSR